MSEFPHFPDAPIVIATVAGDPADAPASGCINGIPFSVARNTPTRLPLPIVDAIVAGGYPVTYSEVEIDEEAPAVAPAEPQQHEPAPPVQGDGERADGSDEGKPDVAPVFDPEPLILGTVKEVADRLGTLTPEQLAAVKEAEIDREKPRAGVLAVIDALAAKAGA